MKRRGAKIDSEPTRRDGRPTDRSGGARLSSSAPDREILFGLHPVAEALSAGRRRIFRVLVAKTRTGPALDRILALAGEKGVPVEEKDPSFFRDPDVASQGVAALASPFPLTDFPEALARAVIGPGAPLVLVLDGIEDPHNCGALLRTALCAGVSFAVLPERRSSPLSPAVSKASAGALEHMAVCRVTNLIPALADMKKAGLWIFGADAAAQAEIWDADLSLPAALCIGGEGKGLRPLVAKNCDTLVRIPQAGTIGSLNASVAGAILLYEALRQRRK
ncbi:MAG: 23S rRNA (guanosine(2251)-2'-O)-methyltransferase RlmB [Thermodesulfobacteriota bacterium]